VLPHSQLAPQSPPQYHDLPVKHIAFASVQAGAHPDAETGCVINNRTGATDCARRAVEYCQWSIPDHIDLAAPEPLYLSLRAGAQASDDFTPLTVA